MRKTLTSFDIAAVVLELKEWLEGARIQNIYQTKERIVILKLHQSSQPVLNLLIEPGKRLHLTSYLLEKPQKPPAFCMALRKHLRNSIILKINQHEFERIVILKAKAKEGEFTLVLELFGDGNIILIDTQYIIRQALSFKRMRDRNILRGEPFKQPPSSGKNPLHIKSSDMLELTAFRDLEVVRALTKFLSISGTYAEETLLHAQIDKNKKCHSLENSDLEKIHSALKEILGHLNAGKLEPRVIIDKKKRWIDATPFPLRRYENLNYDRFHNFNEALDEFYAKTLVEREAEVATDKVEEEITRQQRILKEQQESLEKTKLETERPRKIGDIIYAHFHQLQTLMQRVIEEKRNGKTWQEIISKIKDEKGCGLTPSAYFESLDTKNLFLNVSMDGLPFSLRLRNSVQDNAATYYERAKKANKKLEGAEKAIEETLKRLEELRQQKEITVENTTKPVKKRRKKAWYEKFRWFYTSEDSLVIGGKDAVTNEILIKKHLQPHDLVFHADIAGAPFVLMKTEGRKPSQQSIREAAQLAASHSRAWKAKFGAIDVYWVHPEQVSKTPPSGEYLQKGAFMIRGKKNYIRKTPLRLAIGITPNATLPRVIGGPTEAVKSKTNIYVELTPGELPSSKLATKIRQILSQKAFKNLQKEISNIPLEEIQSFIPFGKGEVASH